MIHSTDMSGLALGFVHKRLLRAAGGFITGGPTGAVSGFLSGGGQRRTLPTAPVFAPRPPPMRSPSGGFQRPTRAPISRTLTARPTEASGAEKDLGRKTKFPEFAGAPMGISTPSVFGRCLPGFRRDPRTGDCRIFAGTQTGVDPTPVGDAVMGRYGAALAPGNMVVDRAVCLRGMVLGNDGLCYNRSQVPNKDRMWPKARKPLLTGGEMRAISIAATAGRRLERTTKRLQKIGLMKKPPPRRKIVSGPTEHHHH